MLKLNKNEVVDFLKNGNLEDLASFIAEKKSNLRYLTRLLCSSDQLLKWRAVETMGLVGAKLSNKDLEQAKILLRTLLWTMNDESGGIGWGAPESMGEIIYHCPDTLNEFAPVLLTYIDEEMLLPGVIFGAYRIALADNSLVREFMPSYREFLNHKNPVVRGHLLLLMKAMNEDFGGEYKFLLQDETQIFYYNKGSMHKITIALLAKALKTQKD